MFPSYNESLIHVVSTLIEDFYPTPKVQETIIASLYQHSKSDHNIQTHLSVMMSLWEKKCSTTRMHRKLSALLINELEKLDWSYGKETTMNILGKCKLWQRIERTLLRHQQSTVALQRWQDYLDQMSLVRLTEICIVCEGSQFVDAIALPEQAKQKIRDMFVQSNDFVQHVIDVHSEQTAVPVINRIKVYQFMLTQFSDDQEVTKKVFIQTLSTEDLTKQIDFLLCLSEDQYPIPFGVWAENLHLHQMLGTLLLTLLKSSVNPKRLLLNFVETVYTDSEVDTFPDAIHLLNQRDFGRKSKSSKDICVA